jgi:hypothetical protein
MELFFIILLVPLLLAGVVYLAVTTYRRYKENQLESYNESKTEDNTDGEWLEKPVKTTEETVDEAEKNGLLNKPRDLSNLTVIAPNYIEKKFNELKELAFKEVPKLPVENRKAGNWEYDEYDPIAYVDAYNKAWDQLQEWLKDKNCRTLGNQAYHISFGQRKNYPEPKKEEIVDIKKREQTVILPNELVTFMGNNNLTIEQIIRLTKEAMKFEDAMDAPMAERIRQNALDKERKQHLAQLKEIQSKVEDEQFELKTIIEARDAEIANLKSQIEKIEQAPSVIGPRPRIPKRKAKRKFSVALRSKKNGSV